MKFYLSSYQLGNKTEELLRLIPSDNRLIGYIPNARDFSTADPVRGQKTTETDMQSLKDIGVQAELLDLKNYFGNKDELEKKLKEYSGVWISGGNVFVLRQAMKLSGFDEIISSLKEPNDFVYGGYSAAGCVLSPHLDAYTIVDDSTETPYPELKNTVWEGLGLISYAFLPHYDSEHPESESIGKEIRYCIENKIPFVALRDGEAIIIE